MSAISNQDNGLKGKNVIITGASGALGKAIAKRFIENGIQSIGLVDNNQDAVSSISKELSQTNLNLVPMVLDVTNHDAVQDAYQRFCDQVGGLDVAINNAGVVAQSARIHNVTHEDFKRVIEINLVGIFNCLKAAIVQMRASNGGTIINTASVAGYTTWTHSSPYGVSKAGVIQLTKLAAAEYASERIRVNCVCPGTFLTQFHQNLSADSINEIKERHPLGRFGTTEEIANAYIYLASKNAEWITGTSLVVDGGLSVN